MSSSLPFKIQQFYTKGVVLDTNLLILYALGSFDIRQIGHHKRTKQFTKNDFLVLYYELKKFIRIITTPNILTETSNLTEIGDEAFKNAFFSSFETTISLLDEQYFQSKELAKSKEFRKFGLADSSFASLAAQGFLVITDDFKLSSYLLGLNLPVINFNHVRSSFMIK